MNGKWTARAALVWLSLVVSFAALAAAAPPLPTAQPESVGMS
jgi:hypothetical protein